MNTRNQYLVDAHRESGTLCYEAWCCRVDDHGIVREVERDANPKELYRAAGENLDGGPRFATRKPQAGDHIEALVVNSGIGPRFRWTSPTTPIISHEDPSAVLFARDTRASGQIVGAWPTADQSVFQQALIREALQQGMVDDREAPLASDDPRSLAAYLWGLAYGRCPAQ